MGAYILRRLLWTPVLLLVVSFVTFLLGHYGPGDPVAILMKQYQDPEVVARIHKQIGLDKPLLVQYGLYVKNVFKGDMGESFKYRGMSVAELVGKRITVSVQLGLAALILSLFLGIAVGLLAALRQGRWQDTSKCGGECGIHTQRLKLNI